MTNKETKILTDFEDLIINSLYQYENDESLKNEKIRAWITKIEGECNLLLLGQCLDS